MDFSTIVRFNNFMRKNLIHTETSGYESKMSSASSCISQNWKTSEKDFVYLSVGSYAQMWS